MGFIFQKYLCLIQDLIGLIDNLVNGCFENYTMRNYVLLLLIINLSCSDFDREKQEKSVAEMTKEIKAIEQEFLTLKIDSIAALKLSTYEVERQIKQNYFSDSIDLVFGKKMNDYKRMRRMLGPLGKEESRLQRSIHEEKKQLYKLHLDISKGFGKREAYNKYIDFEKNKVSQIHTLYQAYVTLRAQFLDLYERLNPDLIAFSTSLQSE